MSETTEFWGILIALAGILITVIGQALYIAYKIGRFEEKLTAIEKKQEKHNNFIERLYRVEDSDKAAHRRIDELREDAKCN